MKLFVNKLLSLLLCIVMLTGLVPTDALATDADNDVQTSTIETAASNEAPEGYEPENVFLEKDSPSLFTATQENEAPRVLLIEDVLPWDSTANQEILGKISEYDKTTTKDFLNVELEKYGVVIFANDQPFNTYENYKAFKEYLERFASLGGVIVFGACDSGWSGGDLNELLPGNVSKKTHYEGNNYVADPNHMIITGELTDGKVLTDSDLHSNFCSHVSFNEESIPAGHKILLRESSTDRPTMIEYPLGKGRVIASGLTWEHNYIYGGQNGYGRFAEIAMEDMYRYAIRVSNIDVGELSVLKDWRAQANAHTVIVARKTENENDLEPIVGASVEVGNQTFTTDENGMVFIEPGPMQKITVKAENYRTKSEYYTPRAKNSRIFHLEPSKNDGLPYVTMCSGTRSNLFDFVDLRSQSAHFREDEDSPLSVRLEGDWNDHGEGTFVFFQDANGSEMGKSISWESHDLIKMYPGKIFSPNTQLKLIMIAGDGTTSEPVDLNIEIEKKPEEPKPTTETVVKEGIGKMDWLGNIPNESDNEIFSKLLTNDFSVTSEALPVEISKEYNDDGTITYKGIIGFKQGSLSHSLLNSKKDEHGFQDDKPWKKFKKSIKDFNKTKDKKAYWDKLNKKYSKELHPTRLRATFDVDVKACGYLEIITDANNKIVKGDGGLLFKSGGNVSIGKTIFISSFPLYFDFKAGVGLETSGGLGFYNEENNLILRPAFNGFTFDLPSMTLEGGIGVRNVATAGIYVTGKNQVQTPTPEDSQTYMSIILDGGLHAKILFVVDVQKSLANMKIPLFPRTEKAVSMALASLDTEDMSLTSRDYLKADQGWNSSMMATFSSDSTPVTLQEGVMPDAMPQLHQIGDKQILLFLRDVAERNVGNHTQLVYSINEQGTWSEPKPVLESDTADLFFTSTIHNGQLVVAWQKNKNEATENDPEKLITQVAENSEICVAYYNPDSNSFDNHSFVTDNNKLDMLPRLASDHNNLVLSWICSDANDIQAEKSKYLIYETNLTDKKDTKPELVYECPNMITEFSSSVNKKGKTSYLFTTLDGENTDLYTIANSKAHKLVSNENVAGLTYTDNKFMWQNNGTLWNLIPGTSEPELLVSSNTFAVSSSYKYLTNGDTSSLIWSNGSENGYDIYASMLYNDEWTSPVTLLHGSENALPFMDATLNSDGKYSLALNTASYDHDVLNYTALKFAEIVPDTDISVSVPQPDHPDWDTQTQNVDIVIENNGLSPVYQTQLRIDTGAGTLLDETLEVNLMPGETKTISKAIDIQSITEETDATITVNVEQDINTDDNTDTIHLGETDLNLSLDTYEHGDQFTFVLTASNISATSANAALNIMEDSADGVVIHMKDIGMIDNTETVQYVFSLDRSKINFNGKDNKYYFFKLSSLENDFDESDNICTYVMKAPVTEIPNPDGEIIEQELVQPTDIKIKEGDLHFDSANDSPVQLHVEVAPESLDIHNAQWHVENHDIVHITSDGLVTPLQEGTTTITASITEDIKTTITVTVGKKVQKNCNVTFKVVNGKWNDNTTEDKIVTVSLVDGKGTLDASEIPTDMKPNDGYETGHWDNTPDSSANAITGDTTYTYSFIKKDAEKVTIQFDANGGKGSMSEIIAEKGSKYTLPKCSFSALENMEFIGWDLGQPGDIITLSEDITLIAQWEKIDESKGDTDSPADPDVPNTPDTSDKSDQSGSESTPPTGDYSNYYAPIMIAILSLMCIGFIVLLQKRRKTK